jgi:hypothetical protein
VSPRLLLAGFAAALTAALCVLLAVQVIGPGAAASASAAYAPATPTPGTSTATPSPARLDAKLAPKAAAEPEIPVTPGAPTVIQIFPQSGPVSGGNVVTIVGTALSTASAVTFGSVPATSVTVVSDTEIIATSPAEGAGAVDVTVTTPEGTSPASGGAEFTYLAAPVVSGVNPGSGPASGGTSVTIVGSGFTGATAVSFGSVPASSVVVVSGTQIIATSPAEGAGAVDVTVTTPGGESAANPADQYTYIAAPAVTGISPASGPASGGTTVTINGTGLTGATAVSFGSAAATNVTVVSGTQITATAPAQSASAVDVTVTTPDGTSPTSGAGQYTYQAPAPVPAVTGVSPASGPTGGGTTVTINGSGFTGATAVKFGSSTAASVTVVSSTRITAVTPAHAPGTVTITVTTPGGTSTAGRASQFTYGTPPAVTGIAPPSGSANGGTIVLIGGSGFSDSSVVMFGTKRALGFIALGSNLIIALAPAEPAGTVDITVANLYGTSTTTNKDQFTYLAPPRGR